MKSDKKSVLIQPVCDAAKIQSTLNDFLAKLHFFKLTIYVPVKIPGLQVLQDKRINGLITNQTFLNCCILGKTFRPAKMYQNSQFCCPKKLFVVYFTLEFNNPDLSCPLLLLSRLLLQNIFTAGLYFS